MPSEPVLDFEDLLKPIPGDDPAGASVPFAVRQELEEARKEVDPSAYDPSDPTRPTEAKFADWPAIERLTTKTLRETSKDLLIAARLTEALTKVHGFAGLADGLHLLHRLISECWDRIYPSIEDGDLEVRAGPFNWLDEPDRGARFPYTIQAVPFIQGLEGAYSWQNWRDSQGGKEPKVREAIDKAVRAMPRERIALVVEDLTRALTELDGLSKVLTEQLSGDAPGMSSLRRALLECRTLAQQVLDLKPAEAAADEAAPAGEGGTEGKSDAGDSQAGAARAIRTRADAYQRLSEAADLLEQLEPHSPIPYLVRKAVELGSLPFPLLMRALIRDDSVLTEMRRELGIKEEPPPE